MLSLKITQCILSGWRDKPTPELQCLVMTKSLNWLASQRLLLQKLKSVFLYRLSNVPHPILFQYIDPIIAATWSDDGAVHDVCKALSPRFREPNTIVRFIELAIIRLSHSVLQIVFKALIVLHTMIRNGATDNVLSYLSSSEVLRLRSISSGNWDGQ